MPKTVWECEDCGENFNSRAARKYHKDHTCPKKTVIKNEALQAENPEFNNGLPLKNDNPAADETPEKDQEQPKLTPKEQFEKEHNVIIPDQDPEPETEILPGDAASFTGEDPEIPIVIIWAVCALGILVAGLWLAREKISDFLKWRGKPPVPAPMVPIETPGVYL